MTIWTNPEHEEWANLSERTKKFIYKLTDKDEITVRVTPDTRTPEEIEEDGSRPAGSFQHGVNIMRFDATQMLPTIENMSVVNPASVLSQRRFPAYIGVCVHESGHANYTPSKRITDDPFLSEWITVMEEIRCESNMLTRFPHYDIYLKSSLVHVLNLHSFAGSAENSELKELDLRYGMGRMATLSLGRVLIGVIEPEETEDIEKLVLTIFTEDELAAIRGIWAEFVELYKTDLKQMLKLAQDFQNIIDPEGIFPKKYEEAQKERLEAIQEMLDNANQSPCGTPLPITIFTDEEIEDGGETSEAPSNDKGLPVSIPQGSSSESGETGEDGGESSSDSDDSSEGESGNSQGEPSSEDGEAQGGSPEGQDGEAQGESSGSQGKPSSENGEAQGEPSDAQGGSPEGQDGEAQGESSESKDGESGNAQGDSNSETDSSGNGSTESSSDNNDNQKEGNAGKPSENSSESDDSANAAQGNSSEADSSSDKSDSASSGVGDSKSNGSSETKNSPDAKESKDSSINEGETSGDKESEGNEKGSNSDVKNSEDDSDVGANTRLTRTELNDIMREAIVKIADISRDAQKEVMNGGKPEPLPVPEMKEIQKDAKHRRATERAKDEVAGLRDREKDFENATKIESAWAKHQRELNDRISPYGTRIDMKKPRPEDQARARAITVALQKAQYREVHKTTLDSILPPGRFNVRQAMSRASQIASGQESIATPWKQTRRREVDNPPITLAVATDVSGSMDTWQHEVSSFTWAFSHAVKGLKGNAGAVAWNVGSTALIQPNTVSRDIPVATAGGGSSGCPSAMLALDSMMNLSFGSGVRVLAVITDGWLSNSGFSNAPCPKTQGVINELHSRGVKIMWFVTRHNGWIPKNTTSVRIINPADFGKMVGKTIIESLSKA